jgi:hypothetical protein
VRLRDPIVCLDFYFILGPPEGMSAFVRQYLVVHSAASVNPLAERDSEPARDGGNKRSSSERKIDALLSRIDSVINSKGKLYSIRSASVAKYSSVPTSLPIYYAWFDQNDITCLLFVSTPPLC